MKKLLALFDAAVTFLFGKSLGANRPGAPKGLKHVGWLAGRTKRIPGHGRALITTTDPEEAINHQHDPRKQPVIVPVFRKVWIDHGRKSKRFAAAAN